jgi:hypothetical protein
MLSRDDVEYCKDLGDSYLDVQKTRVAMELRLFQMQNKHLVKIGLCERIVVDDTARGKKKSGIRFIRADEPVEDDIKPLAKLVKKYDGLKAKEADKIEFEKWYSELPEELKQDSIGTTYNFVSMTTEGLRKKLKKVRDEIKLGLNELSTRSQTFKRFNERFKDLEKLEKNILGDGEEVFGNTKLWEWCARTRGLGPVAALTFLSNIDVFTSPTVGNCWSNFGLIPGKTLKRGESTNFNPHVRARILGVICNNIIRSGDEYYAGVYHIKKEYHRARPDLIAKQETEPKSWDMHMHRMSYRVLAKLLVSHAYQLIKADLGVGTEEILHRNPIPPKPVDKISQEKVLANYQMNHDMMLSKLKPLWEVIETIDKELKDAKGETDQPKTTQEILEIEDNLHRALEAYDLELKHPSKLI